jgi:hypothetical protein
MRRDAFVMLARMLRRRDILEEMKAKKKPVCIVQVSRTPPAGIEVLANQISEICCRYSRI